MWTTKFNKAYICGGADAPCTRTTATEANRYLSVGPPYIAHVDDLRGIAAQWWELVPRIYEEYPYLLAEVGL